TEFKNHAMNEFCAKKGIKREFSVARTPQQNDVAERKNKTLIEAAKTMLEDSLLPIPFWAEAVNTACYVLNRIPWGKFNGKSDTEAEYVAAANCCGQVLWIQNQMMDYGFNFMNTKIHIDNESTISVIKNPIAHSRTKHIEIRFHFIRDCYEKRLIEVVKIHTDSNVADLLTKGFDVTRFNFLVKLCTASTRINTARLTKYCSKMSTDDYGV
ncbi:putative ribonuclease H-like domain-containing protein, partial [Tanacetum coccineum]